MVAFIKRMPAGIAGTVTRSWLATIETDALSLTSTLPVAYGQFVNLDSAGTVRAMSSTDTAAFGVYVRPFPVNDNAQDPLGTSTPPTSGFVDILKAGYISVSLGGTTAPVKGGTIYIWIAATSGSHVQGQVEAASTSGSTIALDAKSFFMGPADANGNTEIAYNL